MSCSAIYNEYDGVQHDYTRKQGLVWEHVFLPDCAPAEWQDRAKLWNVVEEAEKTKDSRLAREFVVALPIELGKDEWVDLLSKFIQEQFVDEGMCADAAIHDTDGHNSHAHIMLTVRPLNENGTWQHKTEKEYLCGKDREERGFTATEYKEAQKNGWEKQYLYKVGKKKEYLTPSTAEAQGLERASKYPKSTKYGRQNPISERWNSEEQLVKWRAAWADEVNLSLEQKGLEERIDHRSFADQGKDEQPTIHEGVAARALEKKGIVSDRCELNRQIKRDNTLLCQLKDEVRMLMQAAQNSILTMAKALEIVRANMIILVYSALHARNTAKQARNEIDRIVPIYKKYDKLVANIKKKAQKKEVLLAKKEKTSIFQPVEHIRLNAQIAEMTEELKELKSEKTSLIYRIGVGNDEGVKHSKARINNKQDNLRKAEAVEAQYIVEYKNAVAEYHNLELNAVSLDPDELMDARLKIRPEEEERANAEIKLGYVKAYDGDLFIRAEAEVAKQLGEACNTDKPFSVRRNLQQTQRSRLQEQEHRQAQRWKNLKDTER